METKESLEFRKKIGKIFQEVREKQGLTQKQVGEKSGVDDNYYARIERAGKDGPMPGGDVINKLAKAFGIKIVLPLE